MRVSRRIAAISLPVILMFGTITGASSAVAQEPACSTANAEALLVGNGVKFDVRKSAGAYLDKRERKTICVVWMADLEKGKSSVRLSLSKNTKTLWVKRTEKTAKRAFTSVETLTKAGRKALGVKTVRFTHKTTTRKNGSKQVTSYRNVGGSAGRRIATVKSSSTAWSNKVKITLTAKNGRTTKIVVGDTCRVNAAKPRCTGSQSSSSKSYRGSFNVVLKEKSSDDLLVSHGLARSGQGAGRYNKVYRLEQSRFGAERNGYARGRG
ncbi:hypothetical protein GCM10010401_00690 [Rarobacter faecitabidus]|uniref:Uncharacterized protein n=1 Tax=Rarobacter faecitabidus TaxID=13243 RepID=A0A542ZWR0_RARFA|nr:hypothetical protein [Rarobacter faecitabidus]TQL64791.1 hypothetical protein FB461_1312 [Rarobacter faecitabidus]